MLDKKGSFLECREFGAQAVLIKKELISTKDAEGGFYWWSNFMERRDFLKLGAAGLIGLAIKPVLADDDNSHEPYLEPTQVPVLSPTRTPTMTATITPSPTLRPIRTPRPTRTATLTAAETPQAFVVPTAEEIWTAEAKITSYCLRGRTASGLYVGPGIVAGDPRFVPLGSIINIEGLGEDFLVADTGSGVKGWHFDVWSSDCNWSLNWGVQSRRILVTRWGWP